MLDTLNRHVVQPLVARRRGSRHLRYLKLLERTQYDPPDIIRVRQLGMLKRLLDHAWRTVPFYRRVWDDAGVHPSDVRTFADFEQLPVLTKADIRRHGRDLLSSAYNPKTLRVKETSGSTGVPLTIRIDEPSVQWKTACTLRSDQWSGWRRGQRVAKLWGNPDSGNPGWKYRLRNAVLDRAINLNTLGMDDSQIAEFVASIRRRRPGLLFGHAHSLYLIAGRLKQQGIADIRPNGIVSTSMHLHDWQRQTIEEVFGTPVTNRYGCEEVSLIACECEKHHGLHLNSDSVYAEVPAGGKLLVTDLTNFAMPIIRYRVGDVVTPSSRVCPCGRGLPLIERVEGREADYVLTPAGKLISGISLTDNFVMKIPGAAQMQIVQETLHDLLIRMVKDDGFGPDGLNRVGDVVREMFGGGMRYEVEFVDAIPQEPSGKYRFCISKVATDHLRAMSA
jgi:phenylacetate-CoA ligase